MSAPSGACVHISRATSVSFDGAVRTRCTAVETVGAERFLRSLRYEQCQLLAVKLRWIIQ
jgi:hypothetical protein